jgi:predicted O-methyltransferase YrrM
MAGGILNEAVEHYLEELVPPSDAIASEMEALAKRDSHPIVGSVVARLLALMTQILDAKRIFEFGSAIGYSTLCFARAAGPGAEVHYTDNNPENAERAKEFITRAGAIPRGRRAELVSSNTRRIRFDFLRSRQETIPGRVTSGAAKVEARRTVHRRQHAVARNCSA